MSPPVLRMEGVGVRFPDRGQPVLDGVDLELAPGQRLAVLGRNGSGKTTLLGVPAGLVPFTGRVTVSGTELGPGTLDRVRRDLGVLFAVPEDQLLFPRVLDDVAFGLRGRRPAEGGPHPGRGGVEGTARAWLDRFGVGHLTEEPTYRLSHGEQLRVALAGALAPGPGLLLLDEPSAALDPSGRVTLAGMLRGLPAAMLMATHDLEFARAAATHWVVLQGGRLAGPVRPVEELPDDPLALFQD